MTLKLRSKSLLPPNTNFDLSKFKKPFCSKEKGKFKRYGTVNFKTQFFKNKSTSFNKSSKILFVSGPARNGNHIVMSMLDGHPQIQCQPGEDFLLREFISRAKENEKKLVNQIRKVNDVNFITNMSGAYINKWKTFRLNKSKLIFFRKQNFYAFFRFYHISINTKRLFIKLNYYMRINKLTIY